MARNKKLPTFIFFTLTILLLANFAFAQRELEVPLPQFGGQPEITKTPLLPDYVRYVFNFAVGISGLVAFGVVVFGGARYLTSAGNPTTMADASNQIFSALIGLVVILGSYLLLTTINPQLVIISPQLKPAGLVVGGVPGVYLCKTADKITPENCDGPYFSDSDALASKFDNQTKYVQFINPAGVEYGVVLHKDPYLKGECEVILSKIRSASSTVQISKLANKASSISVFRHATQASGAGVTLYECKEYDTTSIVGPPWDRHTCAAIGPYRSEIEIKDINTVKKDFDNEVSSIKIEGNYMAILYKNFNIVGDCLVVRESDSNLSNEGFDNNVKSFKILFRE